ncbi:MAG: flagellar hook-associated protein FlgL [Acidimicrobiales bacterium]|nr:flagellar hook-associated protein FlgL [Acidimicrobiales bacterium]MCB9392753.1 flagellar hook-associated protein FlgL [Acidimicrobiaceae bacterium]
MRVTSSMMVRSTLRDLSQGLSRLQETQTKLATGKELTRPSVNPGATANAMGMRQEMRRAEQRVRSLNDAAGWLETADGALTSSLTSLGRAKELAVRASNTGAIGDPQARQAIAAEIRSIRSEMLALSNSTYGGRSIFNGTAVGAAYDANGVYQGNAASIVRDVAPSTTVAINLTGPEVFGTAGGPVGDVFEVLDRLATAIQAGDSTAMATEHTNLDSLTSVVSGATVEIGTRAARLAETKIRAEDQQLLLTEQLSEVEDVDIVEALITAKAQENSYQAALQAAAKILPPSLLDYLR